MCTLTQICSTLNTLCTQNTVRLTNSLRGALPSSIKTLCPPIKPIKLHFTRTQSKEKTNVQHQKRITCVCLRSERVSSSCPHVSSNASCKYHSNQKYAQMLSVCYIHHAKPQKHSLLRTSKALLFCFYSTVLFIYTVMGYLAGNCKRTRRLPRGRLQNWRKLPGKSMSSLQIFVYEQNLCITDGKIYIRLAKAFASLPYTQKTCACNTLPRTTPCVFKTWVHNTLCKNMSCV